MCTLWFCNVHVHCINHNVGEPYVRDKSLVVICNVDTKTQGTPCLFSSDNLPAYPCIPLYQDRGYDKITCAP